MNNKDKIEIINILKNIVAINSAYPTGNTSTLNQYIYRYLKNSKLHLSLEGPGKDKLNLIAKNFKGNSKSIVFNSHIDTVQPNINEWTTDPFRLIKKGNFLYGLGSVNCKGSAAVQIYLAKQLKNIFPNIKENISFTFVGDEENLGPDGSYYLRKKKLINPHTLILGAPTNNNFIVEERGVFWTSVHIKGKTSHAGEPHKGVNAIEKATKIIHALQTKYKKSLSKFNIENQLSTMNIGLIEGGHNVNVVPADAYFQIDRRITKQEKVTSSFHELKQFIQKCDPSAKVIFDTGTNGFSSNKNNIYLNKLYNSYLAVKKNKPKFLSCIGVSDGRYFANDKINIVNIGPGDGDEGHKSNEKMKISDLFDYYKILCDFLKNL